MATLKEPYRIEGKKTMGLEIAEQLGWRMPDVIVYPTGGGVGLIGIHKALTEPRELGWVEGDLPRLVSVQATGCAPIVTAFEAGAARVGRGRGLRDRRLRHQRAEAARRLPDPRGGARRPAGPRSRSTTPTCSPTSPSTARLEGMFLCPEGAATVTAARHLAQTGWLSGDDEVVLLNTGAGVIYPDTVTVDVPTLAKDGVLVL